MQTFSTTGVNNFGPVYVRNMFNRNDCEMRKVWVTLFTCSSTRNIILDVVPSLSAESFIISFGRFISRRGCPDNIMSMVSDNGKNFVSKGSQNFISNLNVRWHFNLPLAPWHDGFFERLVCSVKDLLKKDLQNNKITYAEMQQYC